MNEPKFHPSEAVSGWFDSIGPTGSSVLFDKN